MKTCILYGFPFKILKLVNFLFNYIQNTQKNKKTQTLLQGR